MAAILGMLFLCSAAEGQQNSKKVCVLSGGLDREVRVENCGDGQTVSEDGSVHLPKATVRLLEVALTDWNKKEKMDFKKPFPIIFPTEKSANPVMFGPRLGYWLKTEKGLLVRQVAFFDNGPDYFEESLARFVARDGKIGFLDEKLRTAIPARFDFATPFSGGYSVVCRSEKSNPCLRSKPEEAEYSTIVGGTWAVIDKRGKTVKGPGISQSDAYKFVSAAAAASKPN